jgi:hypothetical protein
MTTTLKITFIMTLGIFTSCASTRSIYKKELKERFKQPLKETRLIAESDLTALPKAVANYLRYCGWVGKAIPRNFYCKFDGPFYIKPGKPMNFNIEQYSWLDSPTRLFRMNNWMIGGRHRMDHRGAFMLIKVFDRFKVADASGPEMNQAELVTYLNDLCILAPGGLIDAPIVWESFDDLTVKATITELGNTISATIYFNEKGELVNFISTDRYFTPDGKDPRNYPWSTPMKDYIEVDGYKRPSYGEAIWDMPDGRFSYAQFNLREVRYNIRKAIN